MKNKTNEAKRLLGIIKKSMKINDGFDDNLVKSNDPNVYKQFMISQTLRGYSVIGIDPAGNWYDYAGKNFSTPQQAKEWFKGKMGNRWNDKYKLYVQYHGKSGEII